MQSDINQTKSRSYNYFLRNFHLGLRILIAIIGSRSFQSQYSCKISFNNFILPLTCILSGFNLSFILYFKLRKQFQRCHFFFFLSINVIICSVMFLLNYSYLQYKSEICKKNQIVSMYTVMEIIAYVIISITTLFFTKFQWSQRYTNTPGDIVWTFLILSYSNDITYNRDMQIILFTNAFISISGFVLNIAALYTGITPKIKKLILFQWILSLILIVICILISLITFLNNYFLNQYANQILKNIALKFVLISVLDLFFWIWGLLTLTYQNGDLIRSAVLWSNSSGYTTQVKENQNQVLDQSKWWDISHVKQDDIKM